MDKLVRNALFATLMAPILCAQTTTTATAPTVAQIVTAEVARLTKLLTLTTTQAAGATTLFTTEVTSLQTINSNLATAQTALTTAVEGNSTSGISAAVNMIGSLTAQQKQAEATAQAAFYQILTATQQTAYKEILAGGLGDGGISFPGVGPGGNGPHH